MDDKELIKSIRRAAMNALARREHTFKELENKLFPRFPLNKNTVIAVLKQLGHEGLQSDQRFAESYIRWRAAKGYAASRIAMELNQKGVAEDIAEQALQDCGIDWQQLLLEQFDKKYDSQKPSCLEDKAKMVRFFLYRGFTHGQTQTLFKSL